MTREAASPCYESVNVTTYNKALTPKRKEKLGDCFQHGAEQEAIAGCDCTKPWAALGSIGQH